MSGVLINYQDESGMYANGLYKTKWRSSTYTLLLLRRFGLLPDNKKVKKNGCRLLLKKGLLWDEEIYFTSSKKKRSVTCITGLVFGILAYFQIIDEKIAEIFNYLIDNQLPDGEWNCRNPDNAIHSSFHTTLIVLEALYDYSKINSNKQFEKMQENAHEFLLNLHLYKSHDAGVVVNYKMLNFSSPPRWKYNILSALDYFQVVKYNYDDTLKNAIQILII